MIFMTNGTIIEFEATKGEDIIAGYVYLSEIDDENCIYFYNHQGLENGTILPKNPYNYESKAWKNYEALKNAFITDDQLLQFLADFAEEIKTIDRGNYSLQINPQ